MSEPVEKEQEFLNAAIRHSASIQTRGTNEALVALTMTIKAVGDKIDILNTNLSKFNKDSGVLQKLLILLTAVMAGAAIIALFK